MHAAYCDDATPRADSAAALARRRCACRRRRGSGGQTAVSIAAKRGETDVLRNLRNARGRRWCHGNKRTKEGTCEFLRWHLRPALVMPGERPRPRRFAGCAEARRRRKGSSCSKRLARLSFRRAAATRVTTRSWGLRLRRSRVSAASPTGRPSRSWPAELSEATTERFIEYCGRRLASAALGYELFARAVAKEPGDARIRAQILLIRSDAAPEGSWRGGRQPAADHLRRFHAHSIRRFTR